MNRQSIKTGITAEILRIGEELLALQQTDEYGSGWETATFDYKPRLIIYPIKNETIYNGNAGIIRCLMEIYAFNSDRRYLDSAVAGCEWIINFCRLNEADSFAYYTGRTGAAETICLVAEATGRKEWLEEAIHMVAGCSQKLVTQPGMPCELINGMAGVLHGLMMVYARTRHESLLNDMAVAVSYILRQTRCEKNGFFWDTYENAIQPLCGLSHGVSGVAHVLFELGRLTGNEAFYFPAEQGLLYERQFLELSLSNWYDLRCIENNDPQTLEQVKQHYRKNDLDFFHAPKDMMAWCHGATGMAYTRDLACRLFSHDENYQNELKLAISKTVRLPHKGNGIGYAQTLCHGISGNALCMLDLYQKNGDEKILDFVWQSAGALLQFIKENESYTQGPGVPISSPDLLLGLSGIAYFFTRLLNNNNGYSLLCPDIPAMNGSFPVMAVPGLQISSADINKILAATLFPETIKAPCFDNVFFEDKKLQHGDVDFKTQLLRSMQTQLAADTGSNALFANRFAIEAARNQLAAKVSSLALLRTRYLVWTEDLEKNKLADRPLQVHNKLIAWPDLAFVIPGDEEATDESEEYVWLLVARSWGINEYPLESLSYWLIQNVHGKPCTLAELLEAVIAETETVEPAGKARLAELLEEQVVNMLKEGILYMEPTAAE